jgi:hypothetical protein
MADALVKPVDILIRPTVVALRALGFRTTASCDGHLDHGLKAPWVDIGTPPSNLRVALKAAGEGSPEAFKLKSEMKRLRHDNLEMQQRLIDLLTIFINSDPHLSLPKILSQPEIGGESRNSRHFSALSGFSAGTTWQFGSESPRHKVGITLLIEVLRARGGGEDFAR